MPRKGTLINTPTTESPITAKVKFTGYSVIDSTKDTFMVYQKISFRAATSAIAFNSRIFLLFQSFLKF